MCVRLFHSLFLSPLSHIYSLFALFRFGLVSFRSVRTLHARHTMLECEREKFSEGIRRGKRDTNVMNVKHTNMQTDSKTERRLCALNANIRRMHAERGREQDCVVSCERRARYTIL